MKYLLVPVVCAVVFYLLGSFVGWEFNPGQWSDAGRLTVAAVWVFLTIIGWAVLADLNEK